MPKNNETIPANKQLVFNFKSQEIINNIAFT